MTGQQHESKVARWLPIAEWLPRYDRSSFRDDLFAGVTVWALVVPQAIAYAQIAGLSPQAGVFAAFAAPLGYALFGSSRQLVVSPTSATAAISAVLVAPMVLDGDAEGYAARAAALAILCGIAFVLLGRFRMGFLSQFIAPAVQTGFLIGLGLTIIVGQVFKILGIVGEEGPFYQQVWGLISSLNETHGWSLLLGATGLVALQLFRRIDPRLPAALIVVVISIVVVSIFDLANRGVDVVGDVDRALPLPTIPIIPFADWLSLVPGTLAIVVIGYSESMSVARQFADKHRYNLRPNRELVALGVSSIMGGVFQSFITSGGASQSAANERAGARTQMSSLVLSVLALLSAVVLLPLFRNLPQSILGAIVISAVIGFVNVPAMQRIRSLRKDSFILACTALVGVLLLGILPGLLITVALSLLYLLGKLSRPALTTKVDDIDGEIRLAMRPESPVMNINASWIRDLASDQLASLDRGVRVVHLDLAESFDLDISGIDAITSLCRQAKEAGVTLRIVNSHAPVREMLVRSNLGNLISVDDEPAANGR